MHNIVARTNQHPVATPANLHACSTDYHLSEWFDL